jgi:hypothetical protein
VRFSAAFTPQELRLIFMGELCIHIQKAGKLHRNTTTTSVKEVKRDEVKCGETARQIRRNTQQDAGKEASITVSEVCQAGAPKADAQSCPARSTTLRCA